jgi:hypothetical protein
MGGFGGMRRGFLLMRRHHLRQSCTLGLTDVRRMREVGRSRLP